MAVATETYQPTVRPARSTPLPFEDPRDRAEVAIGEGMSKLGQQLHGEEVRTFTAARKLKADAEAADFAVRFARSRAAFDDLVVQQRNAAAPGAEGHAEGIRTAWQAEEARLLEGFTEAGNLNAAREQIAGFGARLVEGEAGWQEAQRVGKTVTDQGDLSAIGANRARRDPKAYSEELTLGRDAIDALRVPPDVKAKLVRQHDQLVTIGFLNGLNDTNPAAAIALLDKGAFDDVLEPQQIDQARGGAMVEMRRAEAAAAHQAQLETAQLKDEVQTQRTLIEAGVEVPDGVLAGLQARVAATGDQGGATALGVLRAQNGIRRETEPWNPAQFDAAINALTGKADRSAAEDVRLATLRKLRPAAVSTYNNNPGEWAAKNGMPPPALDLAAPQSVADRLRWARSVEQTTGRPVAPLLPAEAAQLRERAAASPNARIEVADQIAALGGFATLQAARQISPNDPMLGRLAQLADPFLRRTAAKGAERRASQKDIVDGQNGKDAQERYSEAIGGAAGLMAQPDIAAAFEVARNIYAARAKGANFDERLFDQAMHEALGGSFGRNGEKLGGLGTHGRSSVLLPDGMSDARFDKALARFGTVTLKGGNRPVWADKSPMSAADVLRFTPVRRPDGRYEFHDGSGAVVTIADGRTWILDVARFAREAGL